MLIGPLINDPKLWSKLCWNVILKLKTGYNEIFQINLQLHDSNFAVYLEYVS